MKKSAKSLKRKNSPNIFLNPYSTFAKSVGNLLIIFSFQFPWYYSSMTDIMDGFTLSFYFYFSHVLNDPNLYFCFVLLGVFGVFLLKCVSLNRRLDLKYIHLTLLVMLELIFILPMMCYTFLGIIFHHGNIDPWQDLVWYSRFEMGYYINVLGILILLLEIIIKRGLIVHFYRSWKYRSILISNSEHLRNTIYHLRVNKVSVNPKVSNTSMKSANC
jgi:hypothetical protein